MIMRDTLKSVMGTPEFGSMVALTPKARDLLIREAFNGEYL